jgi:hypothetical protein
MKKQAEVIEAVEEAAAIINEWLPKLQAATTVTEMKSALSQMTGEQVQTVEVQTEIVRITGG